MLHLERLIECKHRDVIEFTAQGRSNDKQTKAAQGPRDF